MVHTLNHHSLISKSSYCQLVCSMCYLASFRSTIATSQNLYLSKNKYHSFMNFTGYLVKKKLGSLVKIELTLEHQVM